MYIAEAGYGLEDNAPDSTVLGLEGALKPPEFVSDSWPNGDGDVALVTKGYHSTAASPGNHMFFLNYLAGELVDGERVTPPCFHADHTWIEQDWDAFGWELPRVKP